jgi:plasmid maintenance system antidote protein VapI
MKYARAADGREPPDRPGTILLKRAMKLHGGTVDGFAREVLGRSRVSIWRWLRKATPIPQAVRDRLKAYCADMRERDPQPVRLNDVD